MRKQKNKVKNCLLYQKNKKEFLKKQKTDKRNIKFKPNFCIEKTKINSERQRTGQLMNERRRDWMERRE